MQTLKRSGPGGQRRNKVETAVILIHEPTRVRAEANEARSQAENLKNAMRRLRINLALEIRSKTVENLPSDTWQRRCRNGRILVSARHDDLAIMLADALDCLLYQEWDLKLAAQFLGCTSSQIVKILKIESRAIQMVNHERNQLGLPALK